MRALRPVVRRNLIRYRFARALYEVSVLRVTHPEEAARREYARRIRHLSVLVREQGFSGGLMTDDGDFYLRTADGIYLFYDPRLDPQGIPGDGQSLELRASHGPTRLERFLVSNLGPSAVYVDVGANNGYSYAIPVAKHARCHVLAIEPDPRILHHLERNIDMNGVADRITVVRRALGSTRGQAVLTDNRGAMGSVVPLPGSIGTVVDCVTLDGLLREMAVDRVDAIKVDIEGGEHDFLQGAARTLEVSHPLLLIEVIDSLLTRAGSSALLLLGELAQLRYRCFHVTGSRDVLAMPYGAAIPVDAPEWLTEAGT